MAGIVEGPAHWRKWLGKPNKFGAEAHELVFSLGIMTAGYNNVAVS